MKIKDIVTFVSKSITPQKGVTYNLYSLPSFDEGKTFEVLDGADIQSNKYDVPNKCILFNKLNVRFKRVWRIDSHDENKIASTEFLPLVVDEDVVDFQYCYYLLISDKITNYLCGQNTNTSGSHKRIDPDNFLNIEIKLPKMSIQRQIGKTLSALDRKIVLNKQINDNLEAMAKQLYDYWFVQFDFPNEEGKPYKSSGGAMAWNERLKREIPIGWTCCSIKEMCDINKKTINKDEHKQIEYLDTGSITQGHISNTEIYSVDMAPSRAQRKVEDLSILYSSVRPRLLHYGILSTPNENFIVSTGFVTLDAKCKKMALMVYYFLTSNTITEHLASIADTAVSSYPSISPDDIAYLDIVIPSNDIIQKYNDIVEPMFRKMSTLRKEIDSLTKQRDELLPLLMNGQASVNYHLSASTSISFDISFLFLNFTNGNSLYEIIGLDYQCFALPLHSKENTHGTIQEDKRHIQ